MGAVEVRVEQRQPVRGPGALLDRRGAREQHDLLRDLRRAGPHLAAVHDVAVAVADRAGRQARGVEAGVGLGHAEAGAHLAANQRRQHPLLLLRRAVHDDRMRAEDVEMDGRAGRERAAGVGDRLHQDRGFGDAEPRAAVFLRHGDAEPAGFRDGLVEFDRERAGLVALGPVVVAEPFAQGADGIADRCALGRVGESFHAAIGPQVGRQVKGRGRHRCGASALEPSQRCTARSASRGHRRAAIIRDARGCAPVRMTE